MIIISDIHGCYKSLRALIDKCPKDDIVIAGDMIDRGPRSRDILHFVQDNDIDVVMGNHEDMMLHSDLDYSTWIMNGGLNTLHNFITEVHGTYGGGYNLDELAETKEWLATLPLAREYPTIVDDSGRHLLVTHACASPVWLWSEEEKRKNFDQFKMHLLWNRNTYPEDIPGIYNVFGHTPQNRLIPNEHFAILDTGCSYYELGILSALRFPQMEVYTQENIDFALRSVA